MSEAGMSAAGMEPLRLTLADGWTETRPRRLPFGLVYLGQGRLLGRAADFGAPRALDGEPGDGPRREARMPVCVDRKRGVVYWIKRGVPLDRPAEESASLTATDLRTLKSRRVASAEGLSELLAHDPRDGSILSFADRPGKPTLVFIDAASGRERFVGVSGDAQCPADVCFARRRILFGRESTELTAHDFDGRVVASARAPAEPECMSFHPALESAAIAHLGLSIWDFASGRVRRVAEEGRNVVWSPDGRSLWFNERDSELEVLDVASSRRTRVLKLEGDSAGCTNFTNRLRWTPDGRFLLAQLSRKAAVSKEERAHRKKTDPHGWETGQSFDFDHYFCILDPKAGRLWLHQGYSHQVAWAKIPQRRKAA